MKYKENNKINKSQHVQPVFFNKFFKKVPSLRNIISVSSCLNTKLLFFAFSNFSGNESMAWPSVCISKNKEQENKRNKRHREHSRYVNRDVIQWRKLNIYIYVRYIYVRDWTCIYRYI